MLGQQNGDVLTPFTLTVWNLATGQQVIIQNVWAVDDTYGVVDNWYVNRILEVLGHGRVCTITCLEGVKRDYALCWCNNKVAKSFLD